MRIWPNCARPQRARLLGRGLRAHTMLSSGGVHLPFISGHPIYRPGRSSSSGREKQSMERRGRKAHAERRRLSFLRGARARRWSILARPAMVAVVAMWPGRRWDRVSQVFNTSSHAITALSGRGRCSATAAVRPDHVRWDRLTGCVCPYGVSVALATTRDGATTAAQEGPDGAAKAVHEEGLQEARCTDRPRRPVQGSGDRPDMARRGRQASGLPAVIPWLTAKISIEATADVPGKGFRSGP